MAGWLYVPEAARLPQAEWSPAPTASTPSSISTPRNRRLVRGVGLVFAATMIWQASNFGFNAIAAHLLGPRSYGSVAAVVAILYITNPLFVAIQTVSSRIATALTVRDADDRIASLLRHYGFRLAVAGGFAAAATAIMSNAIARFLRLPSGSPVAIVAAGLAFWMVTHAQRGVFQGLGRFERYSLSTIAEATTKLVGAAFALLWISRTVDGAAAALTASAVLAFAVNQFLLRFLPKRRAARARLPLNAVHYSTKTLASLVLLALLLSVDVLAAKRFLPPHTAGLYAAVSLSGKIVYFATASLSLVLFPTFSARHESGRDARRPLLAGLAVLGAGSAVLIPVYAVAPELVITPLFGSRYDVGSRYLAPIGVAFAFYGVAYLTAMYLLSRGDASGIVALAVGVLAQLGGLYTFHNTIWQIIGVELAVLAPTAVALSALAFRRAPLRLLVAPAP